MVCQVRHGMPVYKVCIEWPSPKTCLLHRNMPFPLISDVGSDLNSEISGDHVKGQEVDHENISEDVEYVRPITRGRHKRPKGSPSVVQTGSLVYELMVPTVVN